jgi:hypothetical protein
MTNLENRLHDTEAALYSTLSALKCHGVEDSFSLDTAGSLAAPERLQRSKAEKQAEWKQQPLQTKEEIMAWFRERDALTHNISDTALPDINPGTQTTEAELPILNMDEGGYQGAHTQPLLVDMSPADAIQRLQDCRCPVVPNSSGSDDNAAAWRYCYF